MSPMSRSREIYKSSQNREFVREKKDSLVVWHNGPSGDVRAQPCIVLAISTFYCLFDVAMHYNMQVDNSV